MMGSKAERQRSSRLLDDHLTGVEAIPDALLLGAIDVVLEEVPDPQAGASARDSAPDF